MKKELETINFEGEILLKDNLVKSSILPKLSADLERNVTIIRDTEVEGAVYAHKLEIENGDADIKGAVYTSLELHIDSQATGTIMFRKTVASSDTIASYAQNARLIFMSDINAKQVRLSHAFVAGSIFADTVTLEDCIVIGGVFATKSIDMPGSCIIGTFNAPNVSIDKDVSLLLPSAFCSNPLQYAPAAHMYNLSLADLGALYQGKKEMENTGRIEMNLKSDEQKTMLAENEQTMLVYSYSVTGKVLAADLIDFDRLQNHFLIGATALGTQTLQTYDFGTDKNGQKIAIKPERVCDFFFDILHGKRQIQKISGTFSIQELAQKIPGIL